MRTDAIRYIQIAISFLRDCQVTAAWLFAVAVVSVLLSIVTLHPSATYTQKRMLELREFRLALERPARYSHGMDARISTNERIATLITAALDGTLTEESHPGHPGRAIRDSHLS